MEHVLVSGACGLVGNSVVQQMLADGWQVTATDLDTAANRRSVLRTQQQYGGSAALQVRWADLTDGRQVAGLLAETAPDVVVHLAAVIPPACYAAPRLARRVTVGGTALLVEAAERMPRPPRLVLASSVAVHGSRNPARDLGLLTAQTPVAPSDLYGQIKAESEKLVRASSLDWVVLRLGGVMTVEPSSSGAEMLYFSALLPDDGRIQTVDVRDVARAFSAAAGRTDGVLGETFLIGGDDSHRRLQRDIGTEIVAAMGMEDAIPPGRPGDPDRDESWFATDWMDTAPAQAALDFQRIGWEAMLAEIRERTGRKRYLMRLVAPFMHATLTRRSPYRGLPGEYADVWAGVAARWGDGGRVDAGR